MASVIIIYDSQTGNTELMANAVAEGARSVKGVAVEVRKIGTKFPISLLKDANAIIVGSPTIYGYISRGLAEFFGNTNYLTKTKHLNLKGKKGAAFSTYGWDRGWSTGQIEEELKILEVELVAPAVSAPDQSGLSPMKIHTDDLKKCRELGRTVAKAVAVR